MQLEHNLTFFFVKIKTNRSPVEMSCVSVNSMLPFHTATASALLNSMLSVAPQTCGWTIEGTFTLLLFNYVIVSLCVQYIVIPMYVVCCQYMFVWLHNIFETNLQLLRLFCW